MKLKKPLYINVLFENEQTRLNKLLDKESDNDSFSNREIAIFDISNICPSSMEDDTALISSGESVFTTTYTYEELLDKITTGGYL